MKRFGQNLHQILECKNLRVWQFWACVGKCEENVADKDGGKKIGAGTAAKWNVKEAEMSKKTMVGADKVKS